MGNRTIRPVMFAACSIFLGLSACTYPNPKQNKPRSAVAISLKNIPCSNPSAKFIHVFVALCDNKYQGIVPVPPKIGNGQDPENNLYWGGDFGVRTFFKRSKDWKLIAIKKTTRPVLQRLIFKHTSQNYYLVADAYDGQFIKQTTVDFLNSCSGRLKDTVHINNTIAGIDGNASLLAYIGHDGLMDFRLPAAFKNTDGKTRDCIILACVSRKYFGPLLNDTKANPLVWTTGLMCPEAYTLHDAITGYINNEPTENVRRRAVLAYNKYQKSGVAFANTLLVSGK